MRPGRITNETLLKRYDKYFRDEDTKDPTNFVVKNKIREGYDYKLISRDTWQLLVKKYDGLEIKRYKDNEYYSRKFIIKFPAVIRIRQSIFIFIGSYFGTPTL